MDLNKVYQEKAHALIPGGAHTYSRGDDQYPENAPAILERGKGAYVWDANGEKFLDYGMALRAITIGYGEERINRAAIAEIEKGNNLTRASVTEVKAAEKFLDTVGFADCVKFAKNGSTTTSAAVKLARAYTGRKMVARCLQHPFFSYDDWFIGDTVMHKGVPDEIRKLTVNFNYNDIDSVQAVVDRHPGELAAIILEPSVIDAPKVYPDGKNFLQKIREICDRNGIIYILDEMITGFRWDVPGAMKTYNVKPDIATFGKGIANGFSVAALAGKRDLLQQGGIHHKNERLFLISTTNGAEMCGLGAMMATLDAYKELGVTEHLWSYGRKLMDGVNQITKDLGIGDHFFMAGSACSPTMMTLDAKKEYSFEFRTLALQELVEKKILMWITAFCYRHGETELNLTLDAFRHTAAIYARALNDGLAGHLKSRPVKIVFRRFN